MANSKDRKQLAAMYMIRELGGDLNAAIAQFESSMSKADVKDVKEGIELWKKSIGK